MNQQFYLNKIIVSVLQLNIRLLIILPAIFLSGLLSAQNIRLLKDINANTDANPQNNIPYRTSAFTSSFAELYGVSYFAATDGNNGLGLWRSDGTAQGTYQVKAGVNPEMITASGSQIFFRGTGNVGLWSSDGTTAGTKPVLNVILPDSAAFIPIDLVDLNGTVFFSVNNSRNELWRTDGTDEGTLPLTKLEANDGEYVLAHDFKVIKNKLYFSAYNSGDYAKKLWVTDGTDQGTYLISQDVTDPVEKTAVTNTINDFRIYFIGTAPETQEQSLYITNGEYTANVPGFADLFKGAYIHNLINLNNELFFLTRDSATGNNSLYKYNITTGVQLVKLSEGANAYGNVTDIEEIFEANGIIIFRRYDAVNNSYELWKTDGTSAGNIRLKDSIYTEGFSDFKNSIVFAGDQQGNGTELWKTNGTPNGTVLIKDIYPGQNSSSPAFFTQNDGKLLFAATQNGVGNELWQSDGTAAGTLLLKDINTSSTSSSVPYAITVSNKKIFFYASDGIDYKMWQSDGTNQGTSSIGDSLFTFGFRNTTTLKEDLYFNGITDAGNFGIYKLDGNTSGITLLKYFTHSSNNLVTIYPTDSLIYFTLLNDSTAENELWRTDGSPANTFKLNNASSQSDIRQVVAAGNLLYFFKNSALWKTNGSDAETQLVKLLPYYPDEVIGNSGSLYFTVNESQATYLWKSDGTDTGTYRVTDTIVSPFHLVFLNNLSFFLGKDKDGTPHLYKTDSSLNGTSIVKKMAMNFSSSFLFETTVMNNSLYIFTNRGITNSIELWKTDGTDSGTVLVKNIEGQNGSLNNIVSTNGKIFFAVDTTLWETDGTQPGTLAIEDTIFSTVSLVNNYYNLNATGNNLFFAGNSKLYGEELYVMATGPAVITYTTIKNGNWSDPSIWLNNTVPSPGADVIVQSNVVVNVNTVCNTLKVLAPGALTVNAGINLTVIH